MTEGMQQKVGSGAIAIQSNRDTNVGFTAEQVIDALAKQLPAFGAIATQILEARVADFKNEVLERIAASEARLDAFSDPAFINTLNTAERGYAFSDDEAVQSILVDLISKRSLEEKRNHKSLTLDQAVEAAGSLTPADFSVLSLCYIFRHTAHSGITDPDAFAAYLNSHIDPFIDDVSREQSALSYLEAQRCATISLGSASFEQIIRGQYAGVISKGMPKEGIVGIAPGLADRHDLFLPCFNTPGSLQLAALDRRIWDEKTRGLEQTTVDQLWNAFESSLMSKDEIIASFSSRVPNLGRFAALWDETALNHLQLTTLGICIGYINAKRVMGFEAELGTWIK